MVKMNRNFFTDRNTHKVENTLGFRQIILLTIAVGVPEIESDSRLNRGGRSGRRKTDDLTGS